MATPIFIAFRKNVTITAVAVRLLLFGRKVRVLTINQMTRYGRPWAQNLHAEALNMQIVLFSYL